jgi:hypothetical protein
VLLDWWNSQNVLQRHVWPGLYTSRTMPGESKVRFKAEEIVDEIKVTRKSEPDPGEVHFSMKAFSTDGAGIDEALEGSVYRDEALPPASPWLGAAAPGRPTVSISGGYVEWRSTSGPKPFWFVVSERAGGKWTTHVLPGRTTRLPIEPGADEVCVAAASRTAVLGKESIERVR